MYEKIQIKSKDFLHRFAINDKTSTNLSIDKGFCQEIKFNKIRYLPRKRKELIINPFEISF